MDNVVNKQKAALKKAGVNCAEENVFGGAMDRERKEGEEPVYICQATLLPAATEPLSPWNLQQYMEDVTSGNVGLRRIVNGFVYMGYARLVQKMRGGRILHWLYDISAGLRGGFKYPRKRGTVPVGAQTPHVQLDLQPGEMVRVKRYEEILATCDASNKNRGLYFDAELVPYCGGTYRVLRRVTQILDERTGKMQRLKNPCFILDGVVCQSRYSECRLFCPRSIYPFWREIWLERVEEKSTQKRKNNPQRTAESVSRLAHVSSFK
jgi:hypothetical protein